MRGGHSHEPKQQFASAVVKLSSAVSCTLSSRLSGFVFYNFFLIRLPIIRIQCSRVDLASLRWAQVLQGSLPVLAARWPNLCSSPLDSGARVESAERPARALRWACPLLSLTSVWPGILGDSVRRWLRQLQLLAAMLVLRR